MDALANGRPVRIGADVGGTFTDVVLLDGDGRLHVAKIPSTPEDPGDAVVAGIRNLLEKTGIAPEAVGEVVHGTTVGSNAILQQRGAPTGLITTRGFRDVLEIGRIRTPTMFDLKWVKPAPLVPRARRLEVDERIGADGSVVRPLRAEAVMAAGRRLVDSGVEAVAICFINSYRNPDHELAAAGILREAFPAISVCTSAEVLPEMKEYERTSTAVVNAYLLPIMGRYLERLQVALAGLGVAAPLKVVTSDGGVMGAELARTKPVFVVGSGPAAGVVGAARLGGALGFPDLVVFDMGGTTAKASMVDQGAVTLTTEYEFREGISTSSRFIKAGGYMLKAPAVDVAEVGSGGGSIASVDIGGLLQVGPESAGAVPGPVCYGFGGTRATVTDANVVLGCLSDQALAGGTLPIDGPAARVAVERDVASPLGLAAEEAAQGVRQIVNTNMVRAIRAVTVERGRDPRGVALIAFGGSGPAHAVDIARALGIRKVVFPPVPGVFCAVGMLASATSHRFVRACQMRLDAYDADAVRAVSAVLEEQARRVLELEGVPSERRRIALQADLRYVGQASELTVPVDGELVDGGAPARLADAFNGAYDQTFGYRADEPIELVNLRLTASAEQAHAFDLTQVRLAKSATTARSSGKRILRGGLAGGGPAEVEVPVVGLEALPTAEPIAGPLVVETYDTTILVPADCTVRCDRSGIVQVDLPLTEAQGPAALIGETMA